ncbi:hypothetical protein GE061_019705 [Apolygus lucorum]|uniref:Uncharacterized protein n=1 Tax=Apolygus lucorum TaxID=248454 RepID=A0A6A4JXV6_APOLU|nr:hypothetical protein GE061_019705 [Apolygus lucorum]
MSQAAYNVISASLALSLICVSSTPTTLKSTLKIVNSTNIRELKHNFPAEDKSGAVAYVYPVGTDEDAQSSWTASVSLPKAAAPKKHSSQVKDSSRATTKSAVDSKEKAIGDFSAISESSNSTVEKLDETRNNKTSPERFSATTSLSKSKRNRTTTSDNGKPDCVTRVEAPNDQIVVYNATRQEVEAMGLEVFDIVCEGDDGWDKVISAGALASLCCGSG